MNISMHKACHYLGLCETVVNEKIASGDLPPKINLGGTRRVGFDLVHLENARRRMNKQPEMSVDQGIAFRATAAAALVSFQDQPSKPQNANVPAALKAPMRVVNSIFGLGDEALQTVRHRLKK